MSFDDKNVWEKYKRWFFPTVEINCYNVMIDGRNFFDQPAKSDLRIYANIPKIATGQGYYYTAGCLLNYPYFKNYHKLIVINLSK